MDSLDRGNGTDIFIVQAYHYAQWDVGGSGPDGEPRGPDILDEDDLNLNVAAVRFSFRDAERAAAEYVEACVPKEGEPDGVMNQPLAAVNIYQIVAGAPVGEWTFVKSAMEG